MIVCTASATHEGYVRIEDTAEYKTTLLRAAIYTCALGDQTDDKKAFLTFEIKE